jgi:hypothetical protein
MRESHRSRSTKGNTEEDRTLRAQDREGVSQGLERVREAARRDKKQKFTTLLHRVTDDPLRDSYYSLKRKAAPGVGWGDAQLRENAERWLVHGEAANNHQAGTEQTAGNQAGVTRALAGADCRHREMAGSRGTGLLQLLRGPGKLRGAPKPSGGK